MIRLVLQEPFRALFYAPFYATLARGGLERRGLSVQLVPAESLDLALTALLERRVDVGWGGPMRLLLEHAKDPASPLRCFGAAVVRDPFMLVGRGERPDFGLGDLRTLRLGTIREVATPWWCLQEDLRRHGVDPDRLNRDTSHDMADSLIALLEERMDVVQLPEPLASQAEEQGGRVWYAAADRGPTAYTAFITTTDRIAADPQSLGHLRDALEETAVWLAASPADAVADCVAPFFPGHPPPLLARAISRYQKLGIWGPTDTQFPEGALERLKASMVSAGALQDSVDAARVWADLPTDP